MKNVGISSVSAMRSVVSAGYSSAETGNRPSFAGAARRKVLALPARHALEAEIRRDYPTITLRTTKTSGEARALVESREAFATIENETGVHLYPAGQLQVGSGLEGKWNRITWRYART